MVKKQSTKIAKEAKRLCKELGVNKLYYNSKGEFFTEQTYALSSEEGDKDKVGMYEDFQEQDPVSEEAGEVDENPQENEQG